jgi:hypothetical protein
VTHASNPDTFGRDPCDGERRERRLPIECVDVDQPAHHEFRPRIDPLASHLQRIDLAIQHRIHPLVLEVDAQLEVGEQATDVRTLGRVARARERIDRRGTEVRPETGVAARQVIDLEVRVHGVRCPRQEHDRSLLGNRALHLGEHALLARLDQLESAEAELVLLDHVDDVQVAVIAGLDAVDRPIQLLAETVDVGEVPEPGRVQVVGHGERVFRALEVRMYELDRLVVEKRLQHRCLRRQPVAEKQVDVVVLHRRKRDGDRQHGDLRLVTQVAQDPGKYCCPHAFRGPADVGDAYLAAGFRLLRRRRGGHDRQKSGPEPENREPGACRRPPIRGSSPARQRSGQWHMPSPRNDFRTAIGSKRLCAASNRRCARPVRIDPTRLLELLRRPQAARVRSS